LLPAVFAELCRAPAPKRSLILVHWAMTSQPPNRDGEGDLAGIFETCPYSPSLFGLIKHAFLCDLRVRTWPVEAGLSQVRTSQGDLNEHDLAGALTPQP
jgi:hypothetical protein